jgi:hypothetical protein
MRQTSVADLPRGPSWTVWLSLAFALGTAAFALFRDRLPDRVDRSVRTTQSVPTRALETLHSGLIGDYVTWLAAGLALMAAFSGARLTAPLRHNAGARAAPTPAHRPHLGRESGAATVRPVRPCAPDTIRTCDLCLGRAAQTSL